MRLSLVSCQAVLVQPAVALYFHRNNISLIDLNQVADALKEIEITFVFNPVKGTAQFSVTQPLEVLEIGTGFMMIKREVFTTIMDKFPNLKYKPDLRTGIEGSDNAYDFFPVGCYKEKDGVTRFLSEDYYFCRLWEECGGEIWTDLSTPITHLGLTQYHGRFMTQIMEHLTKQ